MPTLPLSRIRRRRRHYCHCFSAFTAPLPPRSARYAATIISPLRQPYYLRFDCRRHFAAMPPCRRRAIAAAATHCRRQILLMPLPLRRQPVSRWRYRHFRRLLFRRALIMMPAIAAALSTPLMRQPMIITPLLRLSAAAIFADAAADACMLFVCRAGAACQRSAAAVRALPPFTRAICARRRAPLLPQRAEEGGGAIAMIAAAF